MKTVFLVLWSALSYLCADAHAESVKGFVSLDDKTSVYVDYEEKSSTSDVVVFLNGLTYDTTDWDRLIHAGAKQWSANLPRYDMRGQGRTLIKHGPIFEDVPFEQQVEELSRLLQKLEIKKPVILLGLSYGGGIAQAFAARFPSRVKSIVLLAPYVGPLKQQDQWIRAQIRWTRYQFPYNTATDDELYDYFLRQLVYSTYPSAEPSILSHPYKLEAVFRMVKTMRGMDVAAQARRFPDHSVHLVVALKDQYITLDEMNAFWGLIPTTKRASRMNIIGSEHKLDKSVPRFFAGWMNEILNGNESVTNGRVFEGDPIKGEAISGTVRIPLPQEK